ncbi:MAG: hypothetical protein NTW09_03775 [Candidatus Omnitrophica bacterium]|nr:hypothetical protein [Candidatus Omnitrophota bacterium]
MLKKIVVFAAIFGFLFSSSLSFAEEKQGIFKKLIDLKNKAFAKKDATPAVKAAAKPAVTVPPPAVVPKVMPPAKAYTREEMIADIKEILDDEEEILNLIPGLKKTVTEKGESFYAFDGLKPEELDKEKLGKIFYRVRQEATRIRTNRLNRQLENIRRNQRLTAPAGGGVSRVPALPPQPPRISVPVPPSVPQQPKPPAHPSVPQPPRLPATPRR